MAQMAPPSGGSSLRGTDGLPFQPEDTPGYRNNTTGALNAVGERGYCSSSSVSGTNMLYLWFTPQDLKPGNTDNRATGRQVRCLQAFIRTPLFSLPLPLRNAPVGCFTGLPAAVYGISGRASDKFSGPPTFSRDGKGLVKATLAGQLQSLRAGTETSACLSFSCGLNPAGPGLPREGQWRADERRQQRVQLVGYGQRDRCTEVELQLDMARSQQPEQPRLWPASVRAWG